MRKREKIRAIKLTIKMWEWLRDNPGEDKCDYFNTLTNKQQTFYSGCSLCVLWKDDCGNHLLFYDTINPPTECPLDTATLHCNQGTSSPWGCWYKNSYITRAGKKIRSKQAQRLINACKRALRRYE